MEIKKELWLLISKYSSKFVSPVINANKELKECIINKTLFLDDNVLLKERMFCIMNDITSRPLCKTCNIKNVKIDSYIKWYIQ